MSTSLSPIKLTSLSCSASLNSSLIALSSIQPSSIPNPSDIHSIIQKLAHPITDSEEDQTFSTILQRYCNVFDLSKHTIAKTQLPHLIVTGNHPPISMYPYYCNVQQCKDLQREVDKPC